MPFGFKTFEFIAKGRVMGLDVGESRVNVLAYYNALEIWLLERLENEEKGWSSSKGAHSHLPKLPSCK